MAFFITFDKDTPLGFCIFKNISLFYLCVQKIQERQHFVVVVSVVVAVVVVPH